MVRGREGCLLLLCCYEPRCATPNEWQKETPLQIKQKICLTSLSVNLGRLFNISNKSPPFTYSITIRISDGVWSTSCNRITFGWLSIFRRRISRARRPLWHARTRRLRLRHLIAKSSPSARWASFTCEVREEA